MQTANICMSFNRDPSAHPILSDRQWADFGEKLQLPACCPWVPVVTYALLWNNVEHGNVF